MALPFLHARLTDLAWSRHARFSQSCTQEHSGDEYVRECCAQDRPSPDVGGWALSQLWLFWVAPLFGAVLAGVVYRWVGGDEPKPVPVTRE